MATRDIHTRHEVRDNPPTEGDRFARESNTWRTMKPYQIWAAVIAAAALIAVGFVTLY